MYSNISDKCKSKELGLEIRLWVYIFVIFKFCYKMISYHILTNDLLWEHRESYKMTLDGFRPGDNITQQWLLDAFQGMLDQWTIVFVALDEQQWLVWTLSLLLEQKMLRNWAISWHLEDACIQDTFQWQWIGKALLQMALDHATQAGCYKVIGDTKEELVPWFEKFGFNSPERMIRRYLDENL